MGSIHAAVMLLKRPPGMFLTFDCAACWAAQVSKALGNCCVYFPRSPGDPTLPTGSGIPSRQLGRDEARKFQARSPAVRHGE